uniref:Peptidase S1 domain-containing protein n=1 Tax=Romanomermis culicivorax TaxID=13658 RepID=A0A915IIH5_ROMCU
MYHGERPPLCGLNYFGYDRSFNIRRNYRSKRIIDGFTPRPYDAPWTGIMLQNGKPRCTVTLISKKSTDKQSHWAFTAKHCVHVEDDYDHDDQLFVGSRALNKYNFIFGVHDTRVSTQQVVVRRADQAYLYPEEGLNPKDVALLYFHKPIKFTNYINGLCLPDSEELVDLSELNCFTCGWGATLTSIIPRRASNVLQCIKTEIEPPTPMHRINGDTNSILKIKYKGSAKGDSGGPIFCQRPTTGAQMFLFGLVHGGTSLSSNRYSTGARMTYFSAWAKVLINQRVSCDKDAPSLESCCRFSKC